MIELVQGGLKNDSHPETFALRHKVDGHCLPCRYLKIGNFTADVCVVFICCIAMLTLPQLW